MRARPLLPTLSLLFLTAGCGDDRSVGAESSGTSSESDADADATEQGDAGDQGDDTQADDTTTADSGETGPVEPVDPDEGVPFDAATGVNIAGITANQGVMIPIANGSNWVGPADRNARLVPGRDTLVRVFFTLPEGVQNKEVQVRLQITRGDGEKQEFWQTYNVTGASNVNSLNTTANFRLSADNGETDTDSTFRVSLWEMTEGGQTDPPNASPLEQEELFGFEGAPMYIRITMVPYENGNNTTPNLAANEQLFHDWLFEQNPVQYVEMSTHAPVPGGSSSLSGILAQLDYLRVIEDADFNMYYFGFVNTGQQWGTVGLAPLGGFVASGLWLNNINNSAGTFVHEVGHDQDMGHIECPGGGMAPFEDYPHSNGTIGIAGYGLLSEDLYRTNQTYNYMTYCDGQDGTWSSDWNWNRQWNRIVMLSDWDNDWGSAGGDGDGDGDGDMGYEMEPILRGVIGSDGHEEWWTSWAKIDNERLSGTQEFRFRRDGEVVYEALPELRPLSDGSGLWISVPIPDDLNLHNMQIEREVAGQSFVVDLPDDKHLHEIRLKRRGR